MDEVIRCEPCGTEFHLSFLTTHVEAFHVQLSNEETITLNCLSCTFSVSTLHKNAMIQHCFVSGHSIQDVETQFNGFLLEERKRISASLQAGFGILTSNWKPVEETKQDPSPQKQSLTSHKQTNRKRSSPSKSKKENCSPSKKTKPAQKVALPSQKPGFQLKAVPQLPQESSPQRMKQEETSLGSVEENANAQNEIPTEGSMACAKCQKEITLTKNKSHTLTKAVGHVLTHLPDLKLFR